MLRRHRTTAAKGDVSHLRVDRNPWQLGILQGVELPGLVVAQPASSPCEQVRPRSRSCGTFRNIASRWIAARPRCDKHFSRECVFATTANTPLRNKVLPKFYAVCKTAGIKDANAWGAVDIHSLRGTFINGVASPKAVQEIVGYATLDMTMNIYAKATERGKREAVNSLPFVTATAPPHVFEMDPNNVQKAHSARTSNSGDDRPVAGRVGTG